MTKSLLFSTSMNSIKIVLISAGQMVENILINSIIFIIIIISNIFLKILSMVQIQLPADFSTEVARSPTCLFRHGKRSGRWLDLTFLHSFTELGCDLKTLKSIQTGRASFSRFPDFQLLLLFYIPFYIFFQKSSQSQQLQN